MFCYIREIAVQRVIIIHNIQYTLGGPENDQLLFHMLY